MTAVSTAAAERNMNHKEQWGTAKKKRERSNINQRKSNKNNLKKEIN